MEKDSPIRSISRGLAVLESINRCGSMSMMEIATDVDLPYPTACRIVLTLIHEGMIEADPFRKRYRATALVQSLSLGFRDHGKLISIARPLLIDLTTRFGWPFAIATHVGNAMMVRESTHAISAWALSDCPPGYTLPILECASGHVYLAHVGAENRDVILSGLKLLGRPAMIAQIVEFEKRVLRIRDAGFAIAERNQHTANPGKTSSIAVPIFDGVQTVGALSVAFLSSACTLSEAISRHTASLIEAAAIISRNLTAASQEAHRPMAIEAPGERRGGGLRAGVHEQIKRSATPLCHAVGAPP